LDVLVEDLRFLQAKTGLDLLTPLLEVKEVHDQVVMILGLLPAIKVQHSISFD
jgi:hypothetical protein